MSLDAIGATESIAGQSLRTVGDETRSVAPTASQGQENDA